MKPRAMSEWISAGRLERRLATPQRPRARLDVAAGEERDEVERVAQPPDDFLESRRPVAKVGGLLLRQLRQLELQREIDAARPVLDDDARLRRQRLELLGQLARVVRERTAGVELGEQCLESLGLRP